MCCLISRPQPDQYPLGREPPKTKDGPGSSGSCLHCTFSFIMGLWSVLGCVLGGCWACSCWGHIRPCPPLLFRKKSTSQTGVIVFVSHRPLCSRFGGIFRQAELPCVLTAPPEFLMCTQGLCLTDLDGARGDPAVPVVAGVVDPALLVRPSDTIGQLL